MGNMPSSPPPSSPASPLDAAAWRARLEATHARLAQQLTSARAQALYGTLASHAADATCGGVVFWLGLAAAQLAQRALRVGAATPVAPHVVGALAVASSSVLALHFASLPREIADHLLAHGESLRATANPLTAASREAAVKLRARAADLANAPFPVYMAMGLLSFTMLGGRMNSLAPSHFANLGAFHLKKASLPATELYADSIERGIVQQFGRLYGCHTCGVKRGVQYHADHMPPKLVAKRMNEAWWRRLARREVAFRFYPQCSPCSNQQATVVKMGRADLKLHLGALRLYHTTGFWLVLLCTGGLYVGGSGFHETADVHSTANADAIATTRKKDSRGSSDDHSYSLDVSSSDHALLVSLRAREKKLRRQRRAFGGDKELVAAVDAELHTIEECKRRLKDTLKRQQARS